MTGGDFPVVVLRFPAHKAEKNGETATEVPRLATRERVMRQRSGLRFAFDRCRLTSRRTVGLRRTNSDNCAVERFIFAAASLMRHRHAQITSINSLRTKGYALFFSEIRRLWRGVIYKPILSLGVYDSRSSFARTSRAIRMRNLRSARCLLTCCDRSSLAIAAIPVGRCLIRTAESVLFRF